MNLSLLTVKLLMIPICCRTKSKLRNTGFKALYYLAPTYFPSLTFPILPSPVQESCVPVSWTNCYSHSLGPAAITYSTGNVVSTLTFHQSQKLISFPRKPSLVSPVGVTLLPLLSPTARSLDFCCSFFPFLFYVIYVHGCLPHYTL